MGTDHQILDGREARPRALLFVAGGAFLLIFALVACGWWKQRTHLFAVPNEAITIDYSRKAAGFLREEQRIPLTNAWRTLPRPGIFPRIIGGTIDRPTWMLAPRWARVPEGWLKGESFGLYQITENTGVSTTRYSFQLRDRAAWSLDLDHVLVRGRIRTEQEPVIFAVNSNILTTSLPAAAPTLPLIPGYDASYVTQHSQLDSVLFHRLVIHDQGLAPWRQDIARFAWDAPTGTTNTWSLDLRQASSSLAALLTTSSTINRVSLLTDGSASVRRHFVSTSTNTLVQSGISTNAPLASCIHSDFHPFFHLDGSSLDHIWSRISSHHPSLLQVGELAGRLSVCFVDRADVDK